MILASTALPEEEETNEEELKKTAAEGTVTLRLRDKYSLGNNKDC